MGNNNPVPLRIDETLFVSMRDKLKEVYILIEWRHLAIWLLGLVIPITGGIWIGADWAAGKAKTIAHGVLTTEAIQEASEQVSKLAKNQIANFTQEKISTAKEELSALSAAPWSPPIGAIIAWHKNLLGVPQELPNGWIECTQNEAGNKQIAVDGSRLNGQLVPPLNNSTTVHDGGLFLRGGVISGMSQKDAFQGHHHKLSHGALTAYTWEGGTYNMIGGGPHGMHNNWGVSDATSDNADNEVRIAKETRPINMSVVWIMRVK